MGSEQIADLQRSGYLLLCFIPYMILSLYPFVQNMRYSWRTSAGICALWAAAETAAAFILLQLEGWTWAAAFHWILGIPFVLLLVARHEGQVLFAQFIRSDEITVFTDCVRRAGALREESGCPLLEPERLMDVLLAHELFHGAEEQNADRIYTRTEKVELWRKPFSNRSTIACLSEMAAMAFAKELLGLSASPYMLDVLLLYAYSREQAWALYDEICVLAGLKENGPGKGRGEGGM